MMISDIVLITDQNQNVYGWHTVNRLTRQHFFFIIKQCICLIDLSIDIFSDQLIDWISFNAVSAILSTNGGVQWPNGSSITGF